jgi:hypothetical protein
MSAGNETNQFIVNASAGSIFGQIPDIHPMRVQLEEVHFSWGQNHVLSDGSRLRKSQAVLPNAQVVDVRCFNRVTHWHQAIIPEAIGGEA